MVYWRVLVSIVFFGEYCETWCFSHSSMERKKRTKSSGPSIGGKPNKCWHGAYHTQKYKPINILRSILYRMVNIVCQGQGQYSIPGHYYIPRSVLFPHGQYCTCISRSILYLKVIIVVKVSILSPGQYCIPRSIL